jgi:malonyl-CoA/methylmalonyl-CoA synthetase
MLIELLRSRADDAVCFRTDSREWTYAELWTDVDRVAAALPVLGVLPGERVVTHVHKSVDAIVIYLATIQAGGVYVPLNPAYTAAEVAYFLVDAQPALVIGDTADESWLVDMAAPAKVYTLAADGTGSWATAVATVAPSIDAAVGPTLAGTDLAAIVYTSGTTGRSKGAMLNHGNLASNLLTLSQLWGFRPDDSLVHALPIFHVHGLFVATNLALLHGIPMHFHRSFDVDAVLDDLPSTTVMMGVPTMYTRLLGSPRLDRRLAGGMRLFISGSAPLSLETHRHFEERTGHVILERYGMTETGMLTSNPLVGRRVAGSVGPPLPDVHLRVVDAVGRSCPTGEVGDVEVSGPNVFSGYWRRPDLQASEFTDDGYFRTGDCGRLDEAGYLELVARAKDLIITGGFNVYPKEIELALDQLSGVAESAVFGVPHPDFGEAVTAVVVGSAGSTAIDVDDLSARLRDVLAPFKVPKRIVVVDELPRNAMGKVTKAVLRAQYGSAAPSVDERVGHGFGVSESCPPLKPRH